jgi:hypothetical protein
VPKIVNYCITARPYGNWEQAKVFVDECQGLIKAGWEPLGPPILGPSCKVDLDVVATLIQAFVKYEVVDTIVPKDTFQSIKEAVERQFDQQGLARDWALRPRDTPIHMSNIMIPPGQDKV